MDKDETGDAINALFYAVEAAVVSLADQHGIGTKKDHALKARAASQLHEQGVLERNLGQQVRELNQARKDYWYEGDVPDLDLESTYESVEWLVHRALEEAE